MTALKPRMQPITRTGVCDKWHPGEPAEVYNKCDDEGFVISRSCHICDRVRKSQGKTPRGAFRKPLEPYGVVRLNWIPPERALQECEP